MEDKQIRDNIASYRDNVTMPGGYTHNLPDTLKTIDAYYMGKYVGKGVDTDGTPLIFENITKPTVDVGEKLVDIDTAHILFLNNDTPGIRYQLYKMQRRFKQWAKRNSLGTLLNDTGHNYPKYGHVVIKKGFDKVWRNINIQNLRVNPGYEWLDKMPFVYEIMEMDKRSILEMKWNGDMDYIKNSLETNFVIYECYDLNFDKGKKWKRTIRAGVFRKQTGQGVIETIESDYTRGSKDYLASVILHSDELDDLKDVYRELKFEKVPGRWLGLGFPELLFDEQKQTNTICYLSGKTMLQKAMHLYFTQDESVAANANDYEFGQIIHTYSQIAPVPMSNNADITAYRDIGARVQALISKKTHNTDIAMGETLPSQTPLGLGQLQAQLTMSFFEKKRETFGIFVRELVETDYLKEFIKENSKEHSVIFPRSSEEFEIMKETYKEDYIQKVLQEHYDKTKTILAWDEVEQIVEQEMNRINKLGEVSFKMPENAYKNLSIEVDIEITGEAIDVKTKQSIYQYAMGNPQLWLSPTTRELFFRLLEGMGESPVRLGLLREVSAQETQIPQVSPQSNPQANAPQLNLNNANPNL